MPKNQQKTAFENRLLVKLRPSSALRTAESRVNLRPLYDAPQATAALLGVGVEPQWFVYDQPRGAVNPWDLAHARIAGELGIAESDVVFVEPDIVHDIYRDANERQPGQIFAVGDACECTPQDGKHGKALGPADVFAWHLGDDYTQLGKARDAVPFTDPRTRIAHFDTGYYRKHCTAPERVLRHLERSFVDGDPNPSRSEDPDRDRLLFDNSGHGTGTLSILAGGKVPDFGGVCLGGASSAEILPLRIANSVILLWTSSFARALDYALAQHCDVATMSMGGLPSRVWREAIDKAYLHGLCLVAAAGNNASGLPTRHMVYPARYSRVIAVCGAMADHRPYAGLSGLTTLEGNYGPESAMETALTAYTPNIPWARFGCDAAVRLNGEGTSAATPQVAAAAALWFEKYKKDLPRDWRRIEAVRKALFASAKAGGAHRKQLGHGILQAFAALEVRPHLGLPQTRADSDAFAFLRVLTGLGIASAPPREQMYNLEIAQRWMLNPALQKIAPDPDSLKGLPDKALVKFMDAIIADDGASSALRKHILTRYPVIARKSAPPVGILRPDARDVGAFGLQPQPSISNPPYRRIRVYAVDPSLSNRIETAGINEVALKIRWETLKKGPVGEYLAVADTDDAGRTYEPVDLDDPRLLAQDGWAPSEGNPQFHQQMIYAVAMRTIEHFEYALGRPVFWRPRPNPHDLYDDSAFIRQLAVRPHAFRQANAFYSPQDVALLFGYFEAAADDPGDHMPGSRVYACLSHDIIAHEVTHGILDGMHRRFNEPTNPDVLALHEAFADIIALMQHFTIPEILESEIRRTRGDLETESMLGSLAIQFGHATGSRAALRNAIGRVEDGVWTRLAPDPEDLKKRLTPHARGAVLVAAVFDAFMAIYKGRIADLLRIYTGGTGILPSGAIHPDLARRLADEAVKAATHVLNICIRALDYLPPVDVTFFEYLRALITADFDLVTDDRHHYRVAFVEAFRRRGIYPVNIDAPSPDTPRTLSVDTLRWQGFDQTLLAQEAQRSGRHFMVIIRELKRFSDACFYMKDRKKLFDKTRRQRAILNRQLKDAFSASPALAAELGIDPAQNFEVHELRRAMRISPDGKHIPQVFIALTQSRTVAEDAKNSVPAYVFRGGSTLVIDLSVPEIKYRIVKHINSENRQRRTATFIREAAADPLRALYLSVGRNEPFAALHALADDGV
jgi:hypothetical protein